MITYYLVSFIIFCLLMAFSTIHTIRKFHREKRKEKALSEAEISLIKEIMKARAKPDKGLYDFVIIAELALRYADPTKWECPICRARAGEKCDAGLHN